MQSVTILTRVVIQSVCVVVCACFCSRNSSQCLIPQGELEPVSEWLLRWECHWLSASPPNLTARRQQRGDLLYSGERQRGRGCECAWRKRSEREEKGKRQESWRNNVSLKAGESMITGALTLYLSMNTMHSFYSVKYVTSQDFFCVCLGLRMDSHYTHLDIGICSLITAVLSVNMFIDFIRVYRDLWGMCVCVSLCCVFVF